MHLVLPYSFNQPLVSPFSPSEFASLGAGVELYFHQVAHLYSPSLHRVKSFPLTS